MLKSSAVRFTDGDSIVTINPPMNRQSKHSFPNDYLAGILT